MKKIVIFGDSFANYDFNKKTEISHLTWASALSSNLNIPVINFGVSGTGMNYHMVKFLEYINSENYDNTDIIIWVTSHEQRIHTTSMPNPHLGSFHNFPTGKIVNMFSDDSKWINENGKHALWAMENYYDPSINYSLLKIVSFLKQWARSNKHATVIVLRGQFWLPGGETIDTFLDHIVEGENFFPVLKGKNALAAISFNEFSDSKLHQYMIAQNTYLLGVDRRVNHLTEVNRSILVKQLANIITHRSTSYWDINEYKKNIYTTKQYIDSISSSFC